MGKTDDSTILPIEQQMKKIASKLSYINAKIRNGTLETDNHILRVAKLNREVALKLQDINTTLEQEINDLRSVKRNLTGLGTGDGNK